MSRTTPVSVLLVAIAFLRPGSGDPATLCNGTVEYDEYVSSAIENCGCSGEFCVRKCCRFGFYLHHDEEHQEEDRCIRIPNATSFSVPIFKKTEKRTMVEGFVIGMMNCDRKNGHYFKLDKNVPRERYYVQENGSIYYPGSTRKYYPNDRYCVDEADGLTAYMCYTPTDPQIWYMRILNSLGMIISMPFLLTTLIVYAILPESNIHRKALMFYVFTLLMAYIMLVTIQLGGYVASIPCKFLGYSVVFFFTGSFFWMNVMCIDMWLAFSGIRGFAGNKMAERKRFILYSMYALGMPTLLVILTVVLDTYGDSTSPHLPGVGNGKCFLADGLPSLYYFYGPLAVITCFNIILFILTAIKIQRAKKETSMLKHSDSKRHSYEDDKQKFNLYLKLLFAMGVNWSMEVISWAVQWKIKQVPTYIWYLTDFCNAMYGVLIFFIFVFKKKIWRTLQKRYYVCIGKPHLAHSLTTTQTTRSMSTTDTGINDHNMRELPNGKEERPLTRN